MKRLLKRISSLSLSALVAAGMLFTGAQAAELTPAVSSNYDNRYTTTNFATPDKSALYRDGNYLTRVENIGSEVVIEQYDDEEFEIVTQRRISMELPLWGGFFNGEQYNFLIFGQENPEESDSVEVIRVVKYDKSWNRLGTASLYGENTTIPFDAGGLDCTEKDGELYVHTAHEMYASDDGFNHQANLAFSVRESDMTVTSCRSGVSSIISGYSSHSFQQRIITDSEGNIVTVDHGDAYPRAIVLCRFKRGFKDVCENTKILSFPGEIGDNVTGASLGDLAETENYYIVTYNYDGKGDNSVGRGAYMALIKKSDLSVTVKELAAPDESNASGVTVPYIVPTENGGYILWNEYKNSKNTGTLFYVTYDADGNISGIKRSYEDAPMLSDCRPIYDNGRVLWYVTKNSVPQFFLVDESGIFEEPFDEEAHTIRAVTIDHLIEPIPGLAAYDPMVSVSDGIIYSITWSDSDGNILSTDDKFEVGGVYTTTILIRPRYRYFFADDVTFTVNGEEWKILDQVTSYVLRKTYRDVDPVYLASASFTGSQLIRIPQADPHETTTASMTLETTGYYSDDTSSLIQPGEKVRTEEGARTPEWFFDGEVPEGISLDGNVLTVTNQAKRCYIRVNMRVGNIRISRSISVHRYESAATVGQIMENGEDISSATITVPESGTVERSFTGTVYDQYGAEMENNARWYINGGAPTGVQCSSDGTVTISSNAQAGQFELILHSGDPTSALDSVVFTLEKDEEAPDTGENEDKGEGETSGGTTTPSEPDEGGSTGGTTTPSEPDEGGSTGGTTTPSEPDEGGSTGGGTTTPSEPDEGGSTGGTTTPSEPDEGGSTGGGTTTPSEPDEGGSTGGTTPSQPDEGGNETPDTGDGETPPEEEAPEEENPEDSGDAATEGNTVFSDVPESSYYYDAVSWAVENGITTGTGGGKFSPNLSCTRAQAVTFLWRAAGAPEVEGDVDGDTEFSDVPADAYYAKAVKWAVQNGITSGTGKGKFSPNDMCSRAQIATFLYRAAGAPELSYEGSFDDVPSDSYYADAVQWAVENGVTAGTGSGKFSPADNCTRAQIVTFLYRNMAK